ncbi:MAG: M16 family metallopeptidase [Ignavibacteriales bacterium]
MRTGKIRILHVSVLILLMLPAFYIDVALAEPLGKRVVLDNGITLLVAERPGVPMIVVDVLIKAGSVFEPDRKAGLANLTAKLLTQGTAKRTATQVAGEIDFMGASLSTNADYDYIEAELVVLRKYSDKGLEIMGDILMNPAFAPEEIEKKVREVQGELRKNEEDPGWVAKRQFLKTLFGSHPYGSIVEGSEESIKKISRADIVDFHSNYYIPNRTIIAVAGDITLEEAKDLIQKNFENWYPKQVQEKQIPLPQGIKETVSIKLDRKVTQANIILGHVGIRRDNPNYYAIQVMNYILGGGGFSSRLVNDIRDKRGLVYHVNSAYVSRRYSGYFQVELQTKNPSATDAIQLVVENMKKIRQNTVSEKELEDAKAHLIESLPLKIETDKEVARNMAFLEFYGLGLDYFDKYPGYIKAVGERDVLRVAQEYLHPERFVLVIVANLKEVNIKS